MADHCYQYNWKSWRMESIIPKIKPLPRDAFFIQIRSRAFVICHDLHSDSVKDHSVQESLTPMKLKSLFVNKNSLLNKAQDATRALYDVLFSMGVPRHLLEVLIDDIVAFGRSMVYFTPSSDVLPMVFCFSTVVMEITDENNVPEPPRTRSRMIRASKRRRDED